MSCCLIKHLLSDLQKDFGQKDEGLWGPLFLGMEDMLDDSVCFCFLSTNPKEKEMYDHFCDFAIS